MNTQTGDQVQKVGELVILPGLEGNERTHLEGLQLYLAPHLDFLLVFWWAVFAATIAAVLGVLVKEYRARGIRR